MRSIRLNLMAYGEQMVIDGQQPNLENTVRLLSKVNVYRKNWQVNAVTGVLENVADHRPNVLHEGEMEPYELDNQQPRVWKTVYHRDIVAAKCMLIKGLY